MTRSLTLLLFAATLLCGAVLASAQGSTTIGEVTVYRGQALVTRHISATLDAGDQEVVVPNLPEHVLPTSLYALPEGALTVREVRYRTRALTENPREEVQKLDDEITAAQTTQRRIASDTAVLTAQAQYLDRLSNFVTPTANLELSKGLLNAEVLTKTSDYLFTQQSDLARKQLALDEELLHVQKQLEVLQSRRKELTTVTANTQREAVIFVTQDAAGPANMTLSYLVDGANWTPAYSAYLKGDRSKLELTYHAVVTQTSGEDWQNVKLTLSTAHPLMTAETPVISPMVVALASTGATPSYTDARQFLTARNDIDRQIKDGAGNATNFTENETLQRNLLAARAQNLELAAGDEAVKALSKEPVGGADAVAVTYTLPGRVSLASRADTQLFRIAVLKLDAHFYYTVAPLITDFVYQAVEVRNGNTMPLLSGPYAAYLDDQFAGRGNIKLVAAGQPFVIGFGTETQLRASRELVDKATEIRGGNKQVTYTYRVRLSNFMDHPARVRVWDRYPQSMDANVVIKLLKAEPETSHDEFYLAEEQSRNLLRWDVDVPALALDTKMVNLNYAFTMEYDKTFTVAEPTAATTQQMEKLFDDVQFQRMNQSGK